MGYETLNLSRKVTITTLGFVPAELKKLVKPGGKAVPIAEVLAIVDGVAKKASRFDDSKFDIRFLGRFEGTNMVSGEVVRAGEAFFPKAVEDWLLGYYTSNQEKRAKDAKKDGEEGPRSSSAIKFTITVQHDPHPQSSQGYKYGCQVVVDTSVDPFESVRKLAAKAESKK